MKLIVKIIIIQIILEITKMNVYIKKILFIIMKKSRMILIKYYLNQYHLLMFRLLYLLFIYMKQIQITNQKHMI